MALKWPDEAFFGRRRSTVQHDLLPRPLERANPVNRNWVVARIVSPTPFPVKETPGRFRPGAAVFQALP
jgi:hypothetical protein